MRTDEPPFEVQDPATADGELVPEDDTIIARTFKWSLVVFAVIGGGIGLTAWALKEPPPPPPAARAEVVPPKLVIREVEPPAVIFTDVTREAGIDFQHESGAAGDKLLPETMGSGAAFWDFDGDADQDLLLVNSTYWPGDPRSDEGAATAALYRNDGRGRFEDVTPGCGLDVGMYGTAAAVGDYDRDGLDDVFVAAVGPNRLFRNLGGGKFQDVTAAAGVAGDAAEWSSSSGFFDYDRDGDLDLFVGNYIRWSRDIDFEVDYRLVGVGRAYGPPMNFQGTFPYLYRNNGDGTFTDVSAEAGVQVVNPATGSPMGKALGVIFMDMDEDGWMDVFVANDTVQNYYLHNQGDGSFKEEGALRGLGFDREGRATGAMGVDAGYYRDDDALGIFIGNFANEMTSVYVAQAGGSLFTDEAIGEGIGAPSRLMLSFGLFLFDYDLDGRLDLLQANGHLEEEINVVQPSQHYEQPAQLFWNCGPGYTRCFVPVDRHLTGDLAEPMVGRAASYADMDADGDLDVLFTQAGRRPLLLRNDQNLGHHWIRLTLQGTQSNSNAIGAIVETEQDGRRVRRCVMPTRSYQSQVERPVTLGLGAQTELPRLRIMWPAGGEQTIGPLAANSHYLVVEGQEPVPLQAQSSAK